MALIDVYNASVDQTFQRRCTVALWKALVEVFSEPRTVPKHGERVAYAIAYFKGAIVPKDQSLAILVLRDTAIAANPTAATDAQIINQVAASLNDLLFLEK
jgi:hypothetical protein